MDEMIRERYRVWCEKVSPEWDGEIADELRRMKDDEKAISDAFYREMTFGTGGLRGILGAGTNRINVYTVARASEGLARYVCGSREAGERTIAVCYDSRIKSSLFARVAAEVFAASGIRVYLFPRLMPTPCLSYAVRQLHCAAGVMVTASHNPAKYNGYKVYGADGCQITTDAAAEIYDHIRSVDLFDGVSRIPFAQGVEEGIIRSVPQEIEEGYIREVRSQSVLGGCAADRGIRIVYTPLNGTGLMPVMRVLREEGFSNVTLVDEQSEPDGNFPTCRKPNPEEPQAMALALDYARRLDAELVLATDPDCDRVGIAVRDDGDYALLSGNETGMLLLDYVCSRRMENGDMPKDPVVMKTIVTSDLSLGIAARYGVRVIQVLTGFKFIGEQIGLLEASGREDSFLFGFEESCGYLSGSYVRDKDGVNAALLIAEMCAYYRAQGVSLAEKLCDLYRTYGHCVNTMHSYEFDGADGAAKMREIMDGFRSVSGELAGRKVAWRLDYSRGLDGLPPSDVLKFIFEGQDSVVVRPSGTEPKLKLYLSVSGETRERALGEEQRLIKKIEEERLR